MIRILSHIRKLAWLCTIRNNNIHCLLFSFTSHILADMTHLNGKGQKRSTSMVTTARNNTSLAQQKLHIVLLNFPWIKQQQTAIILSEKEVKRKIKITEPGENVNIASVWWTTKYYASKTKSCGSLASLYCAWQMTVYNFCFKWIFYIIFISRTLAFHFTLETRRSVLF